MLWNTCFACTDGGSSWTNPLEDELPAADSGETADGAEPQTSANWAGERGSQQLQGLTGQHHSHRFIETLLIPLTKCPGFYLRKVFYIMVFISAALKSPSGSILITETSRPEPGPLDEDQASGGKRGENPPSAKRTAGQQQIPKAEHWGAPETSTGQRREALGGQSGVQTLWFSHGVFFIGMLFNVFFYFFLKMVSELKDEIRTLNHKLQIQESKFSTLNLEKQALEEQLEMQQK